MVHHPTSKCLAVCVAVLFGGMVRPSVAQSAASPAPTVSFTLDFPNSEPSHYVISISRDGHSSYESNGKLTADSEATEPFKLEFTASEPTRERVFDLAKRAHYFRGDLDSKNHNLAFTGKKTLAYSDGSTHNEGSYNYSPVAPVSELTQLFQNLSLTLEYGRRLEYYHHYQKLALDEELKGMEEALRDGNLQEIGAVTPILQRIIDDKTVMNVVRARAQRMLILAANPPAQ
ncbi:MAG TPA: hypothetical protein VMH85_09340 [Terriglobales bacterium]|nr:hypothetical protein [Terriglobales bacterium]